MNEARCLIFQRDHGILINTASPSYSEARDAVRQFAELRHSGGGYHLYQVTDVALWSAVASGVETAAIESLLHRFGEHSPPASLLARIQEFGARYGRLRLVGAPGALRLMSSDPALLRQLVAQLGLEDDDGAYVVPDAQRGAVKRALVELGYPVVDEAALGPSEPVRYGLRPGVGLRPYQREAVERLTRLNWPGAVVLLPCGSGKTVVGVAAAAGSGARALVVTPSRTVADQWSHHFRTLTTLPEGDVQLYRKGGAVGAVTVATYQALTAGDAHGLAELMDVPWGLVIYDEVHSLPAEVFRQSASLQSRRRLGLTATLVREDGRERDVFALVGPAAYSAPWRQLEQQGWIAPVDCVEVRVRPPTGRELTPARALAAKIEATRALLRQHRSAPTLLIAHRLQEVAALARAVGAPAITGQTPQAQRQALYEAFRRGEINCLALSRVANVGVDLPAAAVMIQLSGAFGSRQEEAQRVGRLLRPKPDGERATFYTLVGAEQGEREFASRRQRFLIDQGYEYRVLDSSAL